ncbi:MAG: monovalent cation/H(+) antiporter subunit G [Bdellovibrionota bacterium]|nr:monovalent cation/H(+) antiporter subunit G [Pseudomonadota bacterium]MDY6090904.1 monovalent cation/H(+) antiporter subunit G [Bdellovibrionota bacterium]
MNYFDIIITILAFTSVVSFALAVLGVIRFPDFYTRVHAASKGDTLSTMLLLLSSILFVFKTYNIHDASLISLKVLLIVFFMFLTGPTGIHTLLNAGYELGRKPFTKNDKNLNDNNTQSDDKN